MGKKQISLKQYLKQGNREEVEALMEYVKPNPIIRLKDRNVHPIKKDLWQLSWDSIIILKEAIKDNDISEIIKTVYGVYLIQIEDTPVLNLFSAIEWISNQLEGIAKIEKQEFGKEMDPKLESAGAKQLERYGEMVSIDAMANGDLTKHEEVLKLPYAHVFQVMSLRQVKNEITENLERNASRQV